MDLKHKHWALIVVAILIAILAVIAAWYMLGSKTVFAPSNGLGSSTSPTAATSTSVSSSITEHAPYYNIDLAYPASTPLVSVSAYANEKAVATMRAAMQETADQFKSDGNFANLTQNDIQIMGLDQRKEELGSQYKVYTGSRTVSYVFEIYEDTLGAHPNAYYRTFTFDTKTGAQLALNELFTNGTYLNQLSSIAKQKLPAIIANREQASVSDVDTDYIARGASPQLDNYQNWYIKGSSLVIVFAPYQVGPYALGTVELPIPFSQLASVKAEYK